MLELLQESIATVNLPYTLALGLAMGYWVLYLVGALGSDVLEFAGLDFDGDIDVDTDIDIDVDADIDMDIDTDDGSDIGAAGQGGLVSFLQFFYVGEVPVVLLFSILFLSMWAFSVLGNYYLNPGHSGLIALLFAGPIVLGGLATTKAVVMPFAPMLKKLFDQEGDSVQILDRTCTVVSLEATSQYGQAELLEKGTPILLSVRTKEGVTLTKGTEAVIYDFDKASDTYLIAPLDINVTTQ